VFEIEADDLTELVRQAFSLTRRRHEYYLRELERTVMSNDPAKVMNEMLHILWPSLCNAICFTVGVLTPSLLQYFLTKYQRKTTARKVANDSEKLNDFEKNFLGQIPKKFLNRDISDTL
jgi:hypothetical protein